MVNPKQLKRPAALVDPKRMIYYKDQKVYAAQTGSTTWKPATINEIKLRETDSPEQSVVDPSCYLYYVHFMDQNRRMDEWVSNEHILGPMKESLQTLQAPDISLLMSPQMTTRGRQISFGGGELTSGKTDDREGMSVDEGEVSPMRETKRSKTSDESSSFTSREGDSEAKVQLSSMRKGRALSRKDDKNPSRTPFDHRPKNISRVHFGTWWLEPWYYAPFPCLLDSGHLDRSVFIEKSMLRQLPLTKQSKLGTANEKLVHSVVALSEIKDLQSSTRAAPTVASIKLPELYLCEFCLESFPTRTELTLCHQTACTYQHPPGNEIYRDTFNQILVFEIDAVQQRHYCERLCLLSRLFLEHKCVDYDIQPFVFYVVTFYDDTGCHLLGYFSKEKISHEINNLSCIMVLPPYQSHGVGRFLIDLSYEITKRLGGVGTPERPLSDLGTRSYHSYWRDRILDCIFLAQASDRMEISLDYVMQETGITLKDIVETLMHANVMEKGSWDYLRNRLGKPCTRLYLPHEVRLEHHRRRGQKEHRRQLEKKKSRGPPALANVEKRAFAPFNRYLFNWDASLYFLQ
ncbi:histone acetyltransferase [Perkinsela sp. CCAP 1560/4]|nr:histone acetyltransferase [Perkinsela sp. CCAP 1560/4]KNH03916.1 histone acetyltransferase [Perkinsela sp. CCAP 1560/4]|eukprot:KNH01801.1 histone acetyltransferase [Perkinsela sp. CCAP 1560/4]